jgi:hypothetical protein
LKTTGLQDFSKYFFPLPQKQNMRRDEHRSKQRNVERRKDRNRFVQVGLVRNRKF